MSEFGVFAALAMANRSREQMPTAQLEAWIGKTVRSNHGKGYQGVVVSYQGRRFDDYLEIETPSGIKMFYPVGECVEVTA